MSALLGIVLILQVATIAGFGALVWWLDRKLPTAVDQAAEEARTIAERENARWAREQAGRAMEEVTSAREMLESHLREVTRGLLMLKRDGMVLNDEPETRGETRPQETPEARIPEEVMDVIRTRSKGVPGLRRQLVEYALAESTAALPGEEQATWKRIERTIRDGV